MKHEAEQGSSHSSDVLNSPERPLAGKIAVVTGGSRDVGRGIVEALAAEGVTVIFSYNNKTRRANEVLASVRQNGGNAFAIQGDTSTPEGRDAFFTSASEISGNRLDFLVFSASGQSESLNQDSSNDFLGKFLPQMSKGGTVVQLQSVPSHVIEPLRGSHSLGAYDNVAINKNKNLHLLRRRIPEMEDRGIRFLVVCPPIVSDTNNVRFANSRDATAEAQHNLVTDRLGLPRSITSKQVGDRIVQLFRDPDVKTGHMEFFNGAQDVLTPLENIYGTSAIYVNTLRKIEDTDNPMSSLDRIGHVIISQEQVLRPNEPEMLDDIVRVHGALEGIVRITPDHAVGHFTTESGLPQVLPGHKQIRAAVDMITLIQERSRKIRGNLRIAGFESAEFSSIVTADGKTRLAIYANKYKDGSYDVEIININTGKTTASVKGLRVRPETEAEKTTLLEDQIIEGAAQAVGTSQVDGSEMKIPLLIRVGRTRFVPGEIRGGEGIAYHITYEKGHKKSVKGSVAVYSEGRIVGTVGNIEAVLVSEKSARRLITHDLLR